MMKKLMITLAALAAVALTLTVCVDLVFDNPLDESGDAFLEGLDPADPAFSQCTSTSTTGGIPLFLWERANEVPMEQRVCRVCNRSEPRLSLVNPGDNPATVRINNLQLLTDYLGYGTAGWQGAVINADGEQDIVNPVNDFLLFPAGNPSAPITHGPTVNLAPLLTVNQTYTIQYTIRRHPCNVGTPDESQASASITRNIIVIPAPDQVGPPIVTVLGEPTVVVFLNATYTDAGATAMESDGRTPIPNLSDVEIWRGVPPASGGNPLARRGSGPAGAAAGTWVTTQFGNRPDWTMEEAIFTIVYRAQSQEDANQFGTAMRTVSIQQQQQPTLPSLTIVLENCQHMVPGVGVVLTTTQRLLEGMPYTSCGVRDAYYIGSVGDTVRTEGGVLLHTQVTFTGPGNPTTNGVRSAQYRHPGIPNRFQESTTSRTVMYYILECDAAFARPLTINYVPAEALSITIQRGVPWDPNAASVWTITSDDQTMTMQPPRFATVMPANFNPQNPQPGAYNMTHVAAGWCGGWATALRIVTVE